MRIHEEIEPGKVYYDVSISRRWNLFHSSSCSCGESKDVTIKVVTGLSNELYSKSDSEINATIGIGLGSISSKVSTESGENFAISLEQSIEDKTTFRAPECGRKKIYIYQLMTKWHIKHHNYKGIFRKRREVKQTDFDIGESQWYFDYEVQEPATECDNCQPKVSYDGIVRLEVQNGRIILPCTASGDKITIYGIEKKLFSKGNAIKIAKLPIDTPQFLLFVKEQEAEIVDYYRLDRKALEVREGTRLSDTHWNDLLTAIEDMKCTPIIGEVSCPSWFPASEDISRELARKFEYPFKDSSELFRVAQFLAQKYADESFPKRVLSDMLHEIEPPPFSTKRVQDTAHSLLADLNLPIYVTTNYDLLMEDALEAKRKSPVSEFCRWNKALLLNRRGMEVPSVFDRDSEYTPTPERPLVYHLYGHIDIPQSLVLTEKDYMDFARTLNKDSEPHILPPIIRKALSITSLLFIGYRLDDLGFRILFEELISSLNRGTSLTVLLSPGSNPDPSRAKEYFDRYAKHLVNTNVYWGNALELSGQLTKRSDKFRHLTQ